MIWSNAKITKAFIGIEDHGIFSWSLTFCGNGWCQGTGAYGFSAKPIKDIVRQFGPWNELEGKIVRICRESELGQIVAMRDIIDDSKEVIF
jgi:hypothetical protein